MTAADKIAQARALYPGASRAPYLNTASRGLLSVRARKAVDWILDGQMDGSATAAQWKPVFEGARAGFAELIGARPAEIALTKNVSEGMNAIVNALPWQAGDNVVLCPDVEHPNNIYMSYNLRPRGVTVREVPSRDLDIDADAMIAAIDGRTRLVIVSSVTFTPGLRSDITPIGRACRDRGVFFLVDAVQAAGVLKIDVEADCVDALAVSTSKGLCGLYGGGLLYCRQAWVPKLKPVYLARHSIDLGDAHESEMGGDENALWDDARRFEIGHSNGASFAAVDASLKTILELGPEAVEAHATGLAARLRQGLEQLGLPVTRTPAGRKPSHIVTAGILGEGGTRTTTNPQLNRIAEALQAAGVVFSIRRGQLRMATHLYTSAEDIDRVLALAEDALGGQAAAE
jgi:cysteine desulfurase/selenocysteine lyase